MLSSKRKQHESNIPYYLTKLFFLFSNHRLVRLAGSSDNIRVNKNQSSANPPRKILLDCGANTASTVDLFRETYPGGHDFIIHSFEIDERLTPYFAPYANHVLHCPMGVSDQNGR